MKHSLILALCAAIACCTPALAADPSPAAATPKPVVTVHIKNFAYHDNTVTIHTGDTVLFVNDDGDAHTVTAADKSYDSGGLDTGQTWAHTFTKAGTYAYFCALHPYMKATIVVLPADQKGS